MAGIGTAPIAASDEQAVFAVVRAYGAHWNRHDMAAMADLFSEDAHWVNIVGWHWPGKSGVVAGHEAIHRTFFQRTEIEIGRVDIRLVASDVAVTIVPLSVGHSRSLMALSVLRARTDYRSSWRGAMERGELFTGTTRSLTRGRNLSIR